MGERGEDAWTASDDGSRPDDDEVFAALYPALRRFASVVRPAEVDADDVVQDALLSALAARPLRDFDDPGAYLRRAIVHVAANHRRRLGRERRAFVRRSSDAVVGSSQYPSDLDDLRRLDPRDRAVLYLAVVEGAPYREIANVLECSEEAARARATRALRSLRVELREELGNA